MWERLSLKQLVIVCLVFLVIGVTMQNFSHDLCVLHEEQGYSRSTCSTTLSTIMEVVIILSAVVLGVIMADDWAKNKPPKFRQ